MNLERQNENTLVIHGISESEKETTSGPEEEVNRIVSTNLSITTPCAVAYRIGKKGPVPRVIKVGLDNQKKLPSYPGETQKATRRDLRQQRLTFYLERSQKENKGKGEGTLEPQNVSFIIINQHQLTVHN